MFGRYFDQVVEYTLAGMSRRLLAAIPIRASLARGYIAIVRPLNMRTPTSKRKDPILFKRDPFFPFRAFGELK